MGMPAACKPCGAMGEACCAGGTACQSGLACTFTGGGGGGMCQPCGGMGQACCAMRMCSTGLNCRFTAMGLRCEMGGGNPPPDASAGN